ncbi:MAG: 5-oxoprolinase, partial [Parvibaculaceae bacterium]
RGGCAFVSTWLVHKTPHVRLVTSEHSSRVFDNAGMCGGYPAPTCQKHRAVRDTDIQERALRGEPLPHAPGIDPHRSDYERLLGGRHVTEEGPYITAPHKSGDVFSHAYNGGGGYGDVLERDAVKTAWDVENGFLTQEAAERIFGIVVREEDDGRFGVDKAATTKAQEAIRSKRKSRSVPVSQWLASQKTRVAERHVVPEVARMYDSAMRLSDRFARDFRAFWSLADDFTFSA